MSGFSNCARCGFAGLFSGSCPVCAEAPRREITRATRSRQAADVEGRVLSIEQRTEEREFSAARLLLFLALGTLLVCVSIAAAVVLFCVWIVFGRALRMGNIWLLLLNRRPKEREAHQVLTIYVRTNAGERVIVVKGKRIRGGVQPGHYVQGWGTVRQGVLWLRSGRNVTTKSSFGPV